MNKISVVINTRNEEENLARCLSSVSFADEIVVVDMQSTDKTVEIAKSHGAKVYTHQETGYVEPARNFAIEKAQHPWVLIVDADEEIPPALPGKLREIVLKDSITHVFLPRKNIIFGKWMKHTGWWPDYNIRFFKKGKVTWSDEIHSVPQSSGKQITLEGEEFALIHHHYTSIDQFLTRMQTYTSKEAEKLLFRKEKPSPQRLIQEPVNEFLRRFFVHEGYKDGFHGLALSLLMAFYELVVWLKLWEKEGFPEKEGGRGFLSSFDLQMKKAASHFSYWNLTTHMRHQDPIKRTFSRLKRKLL